MRSCAAQASSCKSSGGTNGSVLVQIEVIDRLFAAASQCLEINISVCVAYCIFSSSCVENAPLYLLEAAPRLIGQGIWHACFTQVIGVDILQWEFHALLSHNPVWYFVGASLINSSNAWNLTGNAFFAGLLLGGIHFAPPICKTLSVVTALLAPTSSPLSKIALVLRCYIFPGYPEREDVDKERSPYRLHNRDRPGNDGDVSSITEQIGNVAFSNSTMYCPVQGCQHNVPRRGNGFESKERLKHHIDSHLAGTLQGNPTEQWLAEQGWTICPVCRLTASSRRHGGIHDRCADTCRRSVEQGGQSSQDQNGHGSIASSELRKLQKHEKGYHMLNIFSAY